MHPYLHFEIPGTFLSRVVGVGALCLPVPTTECVFCVSADVWWGVGTKWGGVVVVKVKLKVS